MFLLLSPGPMSPWAVSLDSVPAPKLATTGLIPSSLRSPMINEYMVDQPVRPSYGHLAYPATEP